jgi:hypothetical protein
MQQTAAYHEEKFPNLASQVQSDIERLRVQAKSARKLAQRATSDCERNAQQAFASQCEAKAKDLRAYIEEITVSTTLWKKILPSEGRLSREE